MSGLVLFNSEQQIREFISSLKTRAVGKRIDFKERAHSTNDLALKAGRESAIHGQVFIAEVQDAGRGRRGRAWESPANKSLLFSAVIRLAPDAALNFPGIKPADYGWIPLVAGLASAEAVSAAARVVTTVKWPNDVVVPASASPGWRKLGGILCESVLSQGESGKGFVVIGIGLNINQNDEELPEFAKAPPSSLYLETGETVDRLAVLRKLLETLEQRICELGVPQAGRRLKDEISQRMGRWWQQKTLCVQSPVDGSADGTVLTGKFSGLDEYGRLKIIQSSGRESVLADAEILSVI